MKVEPLSISHQNLISEKLKRLNINLSEYSFANLYLFRKTHHYELVINDEVFIRGVTRDGNLFYMPIFRPECRHLAMIQSLISLGELLFPIPQEWLPPFQTGNFEMSSNKDDSDYLFHVDKLALYPGRNLSKKRNLVKQLLSAHKVKVSPLKNRNREIAIDILKHWQEEQSEEKDTEACLEALQMLDILYLQGEIFYIDEKPEGFVIGEWINPSCFVVHFEKADKNMKGLYQYLLQHLAQSLDNHDAWINLEQDLGSPAIRQSKHSYQPDIIVPK